MPALTKILQNKLIPWTQQNPAKRFIITQSRMRPIDLPNGVELVKRKITEKRIIVKNQRLYNNSRHVTAYYPKSNLVEVQKYKLMCVLGGAIDYPISDYSIKCDANHFIFVPPGLPCCDGSQSYVDSEKSTFCNVLFFLLHPNAIQYWITRWPPEKRPQTENALVLDQRVISLFHTLMEEVFVHDAALPLAQEGLLVAFLSLLQREVNSGRIVYVQNDNPDAVLLRHLNPEESSDFKTRLERYIKANISKPLFIEEAAREMFLSRAQFTRTVRQETGMSFNEFLNAFRIEEAKVLLRDSQWTISAISSFIGLTSASYFRTFFRKHTGQTPSEFRDSTIV